MTFVNLLKRKRDRVGLEPVFDFQWHSLKNKTHLICDFVPSWDVQFGKIHKFTVAQQLQQAKKDFIGIGKASWNINNNIFASSFITLKTGLSITSRWK